MTEVERPTLIESKTIDEEFPRTHRYPNAKDLNEEQVRRREDDIKELRDKYPTLPDAWIEMASRLGTEARLHPKATAARAGVISCWWRAR